MIKNYLKIAFRNIWKNKVFSAINVVGLAVSMAACIVILLFVSYENSFDSFHKKNLYRLDEVQKFPGMVAPQKVALSMYPMGPTLMKDYPEVRDFVRVRPGNDVMVTRGETKVELPKILWADQNFPDMFGFKLIEGDKRTVLKEKNSIVLTSKSAKSIFKNENPVGQTVYQYSNDTLALKVTGVIEDVPGNSHLQFDALISFNTIAGPQAMDNWGGNWLVTYLELAPDANIAALEKKFPAFLKRNMKEDGWKFYELFLQPMSAVHSSSVDITHDYLNHQKFDKKYTYVFTVIAAIVLIIACVNFMNLSTARSTGRAKEVGIRKSIGAFRLQLAGQFIGESVLLTLISLILAVVLVKIFLPGVNNFSQRNMEFSIFTNPVLLLSLLGGTLFIGFLSGLYPAAFLSAFEPIEVLKGTLKTGKSTFRNILVITQFTSAVFLIISTGFAVKQLRFMVGRDPGFNKDQVVLIPLDSQSGQKYNALKQTLLNNPDIESVTGSQQRLGNNFHQTGVAFKGNGQLREFVSSQVVVDPDYLKLYKIKLLAGRQFTDSPADNGKTYIINRALAQEILKEEKGLTMESLIGRRFGFGGMDSLSTIVGISEDFNFNSLHHKIETLCLFNNKDWGYSEMSVRIKGGKSKEAVEEIRSTFQSIVPGQPFKYSFLDAHFAELYQADSQVSRIVGILAGLAVFISCLGLFGLASYSAERRIKEIGVRKVLGASVPGLVALLSGDFMRLVGISILIACPIAWWAVSTWLEDFAYRIEIEWWIFIAAGVLAILVAFFTISFQSIRAALVNPVKSLKSE